MLYTCATKKELLAKREYLMRNYIHGTCYELYSHKVVEEMKRIDKEVGVIDRYLKQLEGEGYE